MTPVAEAQKTKTRKIPPASEREVWTAEDAAEYLVMTARHVTNLAKRGEIKGRQYGTIWRFRREDIVNFH